MSGLPLEKPHKFENLDALRGVAALIVVTFHTDPLFGRRFFPRGYLSVDLFFMLSGFVLSFAYQRKLDNGLPTLQFLKLRAIRLYPLYLLGLSIGFCFSLAQARWQHRTHLGHSLLLLLPALFFFPLLPSGSQSSTLAFPYNVPTWSLFSELVANVGHALFLRNRSTVTLCVPLAVSGTLLCLLAFQTGSIDFGPMRNEILTGLLRVCFSYLAGMLLFRFWKAARPEWRIWAPFPGILLCILLATPLNHHFGGLIDATMVLLVFPVVILLAACSQPSRGFQTISSVLGTASYAIYVLHVPVDQIFTSIILAIWKRPTIALAPWAGIVFLILITFLAVVLDLVFDIPVRRWLRSRFVESRT